MSAAAAAAAATRGFKVISCCNGMRGEIGQNSLSVCLSASAPLRPLLFSSRPWVSQEHSVFAKFTAAPLTLLPLQGGASETKYRASERSSERTDTDAVAFIEYLIKRVHHICSPRFTGRCSAVEPMAPLCACLPAARVRACVPELPLMSRGVATPSRMQTACVALTSPHHRRLCLS